MALTGRPLDGATRDLLFSPARLGQRFSGPAGAGAPDEIRSNEQVVEAYVGVE